MFLSFCLVFANFIFALLIKLLLIKKRLSELMSLGETTNSLIDAPAETVYQLQNIPDYQSNNQLPG